MELIFDAERDFKNCLDTAYKEGYKEGLAAAKEEIKAANKAEGLAEEIAFYVKIQIFRPFF